MSCVDFKPFQNKLCLGPCEFVCRAIERINREIVADSYVGCLPCSLDGMPGGTTQSGSCLPPGARAQQSCIGIGCTIPFR